MPGSLRRRNRKNPPGGKGSWEIQGREGSWNPYIKQRREEEPDGLYFTRFAGLRFDNNQSDLASRSDQGTIFVKHEPVNLILPA
jgi:hypothetical protein